MDTKSIRQSATGALLAFVTFILVASAFPAPALAASSSPVYFSFTMLAPNTNPVRVQWAEIIQNSYQSNGIAANLVFTGFGALIDRVWGGTPGQLFDQGGYDAIFLGWGGGTVLPDFGTDNVVNYKSSNPTAEYPPNGNNYAFFDNATYNTLAGEYATSFNVTQREQLAQQMVKIVAQQRPFLIIIGGLGATPDNPVASYVYPWNQQATYNTALPAQGDFQHWKLTGGHTVINVGESGDISCQYDIPTAICNSQYNAWVSGNYASALEELDPRTLNFYDALATKITSTPDHLTWTVSFRAHNFQDSVPVTANDYVFTFMYGLISAVGDVNLGTYQGLLGLNSQFTYLNGTTDYVMNGTYYHGTAPAGFVANSTFTAVNATTFKFTMPTPYPFTDPTLTGISALPMHILEKIPPSQLATSFWTTLQTTPTTVTWKTQEYGGNGSYAWAYGAVGDGAYHYTGYDKVAQVGTFQKWPGYWNASGLQALGEFNAQTVHIDHITGKDAAIADFSNGQVNTLDNNYQFDKSDAAAISAAGGVNIFMNAPNNGWQELGLNLKQPVFGTGTGTPLGQQTPSKAAYAALEVRKAMSYLIPRAQIVSQLLQGLGVVGITQFCTCFASYMPAGLQPDPYNPTQALSFLAAAGYNTGVAPPSTGTSVVTSQPITIPASNVKVPAFILGNSFTLSGLYTPEPLSIMEAAGGYGVVLQQSTDNGTTWLPVDSAYTTSAGYFSMTYTPTVSGALEYRLFYTGVNSTYAQAHGIGSPSALSAVVYPIIPASESSDWKNSSDISYGSVSTVQIGTLAGVLSQLASGSQLQSLASQLSSQLSGVSSSISTLQSGQQTANGQISTLQSSMSSVQSSLSSVSSQLGTLSSVAYAALAVAIVLGLIAIALSRRKPKV